MKECKVCHIPFNEEQILNNECPCCHSINSFEDDYILEIKQISTDSSFIDAMIKLYEEDPIEYQLKLSQFKNQLQQQENIKQNNDNTPKCPTCGSTKLSKVPTASKAGSVFLFGLLSQKVKKTWHCDNCKYEW